MDAATSSPDGSPPATAFRPPRDAATGRRPPARAGDLLHSGVTVGGFYAMHALGATVPLAAGVVLFGWRAAVGVGVVVLAAVLAMFAWRAVGPRGQQLRAAQTIWMAMLLGLMLPPHLASTAPLPSPTDVFDAPPWPILAAGGVLVVVFSWLIGGIGTGRFHSSLAAILALTALFWAALAPHWVLSRKTLVAGNLLKAPPPGLLAPPPIAWLDRPPEPGLDGFWTAPASQWLTLYTRGDLKPDRGHMPLHELLRDRMPPLEDLVVGGHPAPTGMGSLIAVVVGGLFLLYRGVIDYRVPLLAVLTMYLALLALPVPTVINESGPAYSWLIARQPDVRWETAVTFVHYQLAAGPAVFVAFFLATAPGLRPLTRRARAVYAVLVGLLAAAAQLYVSVAVGPYIALAAAGLLAPTLDQWFSPRTLV